MDFDLTPDTQGLFLDVKYPHEDKPRYTIDLINMSCTCMGFTMGKMCKHIEEVKFRLNHAGVKLGRFKIKEAID